MCGIFKQNKIFYLITFSISIKFIVNYICVLGFYAFFFCMCNGPFFLFFINSTWLIQIEFNIFMVKFPQIIHRNIDQKGETNYTAIAGVQRTNKIYNCIIFVVIDLFKNFCLIILFEDFSLCLFNVYLHIF